MVVREEAPGIVQSDVWCMRVFPGKDEIVENGSSAGK
jgi:hypothetical protein